MKVANKFDTDLSSEGTHALNTSGLYVLSTVHGKISKVYIFSNATKSKSKKNTFRVTKVNINRKTKITIIGQQL